VPAFCQECKDLGQDHREVVDLCLSSPLWTGILLCGLTWLKNPFHMAMDKWFMDRYNAGKRRFLILTPRGHLKTSYFGTSLLTWRTLGDTEARILYMMASSKNAEKTLEAVTNIFATNENLEHFFPNRKFDYSDPKSRSRANYLRLPRHGNYREGSIEAHGTDSRIIGGHFTDHILDDLIDNTMVDSEVMQRKAVDFLKRSNPLFVKPAEDLRVVVGTRWPGEFYNWATDPSEIIAQTHETLLLGCYVDPRYREFLSSMDKVTILDDGSPIWPYSEANGCGFTEETLNDIRKESEYDFVHQYLNQEVSDEMRRFRSEDIKYYNISTTRHGQPAVMVKVGADTIVCPIDKLYRSMTIDPATGEGKHTDESAITVCGHDRQTGLIFVLDAWAGRALPYDLIEKIMNMAEEWNPHVVAPEDVSFQKTFKWALKKTMVERAKHFPIRPVKPGTKSKGARIIDALQPFIRNQQVFFTKGQRKLVNELVNLQVVGGKVVGRSPNLADSLAYHVEFWRGKPGQRVEDEDEIDYFDAYAVETGRAYALECAT
jgi:predicted phage terminase large subunit-like protein